MYHRLTDTKAVEVGTVAKAEDVATDLDVGMAVATTGLQPMLPLRA
jgi:hypothetical protein